MMPFVLMRKKEAKISHFPLNPLCAVGPLAAPMMEHNLEGDLPSPHGPNSAWKFCVDHNALICSLGTNLEHHNTTIHVAEEAYGDWPWTDDEWYEHRKFEIIDENKQSQKVVVKNRKEKWGKLHLAGINMNNAEKKAGILKSEKIDGQIQVGFAEASKVIAFLRGRNSKGYPYYVFPWQKR
jgi:Aminoglycoside 3-N-acetyltransferase.